MNHCVPTAWCSSPHVHIHTHSLTHILFILTQTRLLGEFMYESRFCSPGTVRLSYISQCPVPSIHPPNFSAYPIQGHGGPVIEQEPVYTLRCHDIYSTGFGIIHLFSHTKQNTRFILFLSYVWFHFFISAITVIITGRYSSGTWRENNITNKYCSVKYMANSLPSYWSFFISVHLLKTRRGGCESTTVCSISTCQYYDFWKMDSK